LQLFRINIHVEMGYRDWCVCYLQLCDCGVVYWGNNTLRPESAAGVPVGRVQS